MILGRKEVREGIEFWLKTRLASYEAPKNYGTHCREQALEDLLDEVSACENGMLPWEIIKEHDKLTGPLWSQF